VRTILELQKKLAPDMIDVLQKRYTILRHIRYTGASGRRKLAEGLQMTERVLRAEIDFLKSQGLLVMDANGTSISEAGVTLLDEMMPMVKEWFGLLELEERIAKRYELRQVIVVPGDADHDIVTKRELGKAGATALTKAVAASVLEEVEPLIVAITGGSTLVSVAEHLTPSPHLRGVLFVPARGGLGESMELQSGTIAASMAKRTGGGYRLMHVPEDIGEEAVHSLLSEPNIREVSEIVRRAQIAVHGIGDALEMARRRRVAEPIVEKLKDGGAVAESFGYYYDRDGHVVHRTPTIGLRLEDIERTHTVIAVAGGATKAEAIAALLHHGQEDILILDEAAARKIVTYS
jgi:central glycolytic genes regulator